MRTLKNQFIIVCYFLAIFASCKKDDIPPIPQLTPTGSFSMEFDDFNNGKSANFLIENWLYSSVSVSFFSIIASANVAIPTIAYTESFNHEPTYIGDNTWQWSYNFPAVGGTFTAKLNGITQKKNKVKWEMYIDKTGLNGFTNFLWFEGSTTDSTAASWDVYEDPVSPAPVLNIEWQSNPGQTESTLKYTYVSTKGLNPNSYIEFGKSHEAVFDRFYTIYMNNEKATISIEWNSETKKGRVKSPVYFKNDTWHCWNEHLLDDWCD
jgi:hypothetical protein